MDAFTSSSNVKFFRTGDDVAPVEVCAHLCRCVEAGWSFVARLGFPQNFLVYFDILDASDDAVRGNVVSLVNSAEDRGFLCAHVEKGLQTESEAGFATHLCVSAWVSSQINQVMQI